MPLLLHLFRSLTGGIQKVIDVVRTVRLASTGRIVGGDHDLREGLQDRKILRPKKLGLVIAKQGRFGRGGGTRGVLVIGGSFKPGREELPGGRRGGGADRKIQKIAANRPHGKQYIPARSTSEFDATPFPL